MSGSLVSRVRDSLTYSKAQGAPRRRCARGAAGSGPEATVLWGPTRSKAARFSTRRQASEGWG